MTTSQFQPRFSRTLSKHGWSLSPEEDAIASISEESEDIDDSLPADLWFRGVSTALKCRADTRKVLPGLVP